MFKKNPENNISGIKIGAAKAKAVWGDGAAAEINEPNSQIRDYFK